MSQVFPIEGRTFLDITMANELTWQQLEALFDDYLARLSDQQLWELNDWLNENREVPNFL